MGHVNVQMRKFVAKYSAGLRVRAHPTLQSEQLGVIKPEGVISFVEEVSLSLLQAPDCHGRF